MTPRIWRRVHAHAQRKNSAAIETLETNAPWVVLISTGVAALAGMYLDVLSQAGIPARAEEWGGGSAMLGGVPVGMTIYVPRARYEEAAELIRPIDHDEDGTDG